LNNEVPLRSLEVKLPSWADNVSSLKAGLTWFVAFPICEDEVPIKSTNVLVSVISDSLEISTTTSGTLNTRSPVAAPFSFTILINRSIKVEDGEVGVTC
jgi:hypothetical protein